MTPQDWAKIPVLHDPMPPLYRMGGIALFEGLEEDNDDDPIEESIDEESEEEDSDEIDMKTWIDMNRTCIHAITKRMLRLDWICPVCFLPISDPEQHFEVVHLDRVFLGIRCLACAQDFEHFHLFDAHHLHRQKNHPTPNAKILHRLVDK